MNVREVVQFLDDAVHLKTGKRLNDLQRGIIEGTLKRQKYAEIAENYACSAGHVKDVGYELLKLLSEVFEEPVDKGSLRSVLERKGDLNIFLGENNTNNRLEGNIIGCVNLSNDKISGTSEGSQANLLELEDIKNKAKIETVPMLLRLGLSEEQIAEALQLPLKSIEQLKRQESSN